MNERQRTPEEQRGYEFGKQMGKALAMVLERMTQQIITFNQGVVEGKITVIDDTQKALPSPQERKQ